MLAESESAIEGWLVFTALIAVAAAWVPVTARILRSRLPDRSTHNPVSQRAAPSESSEFTSTNSGRSRPRPLRSVRYGSSPQVRRSPRHAVAAHRTLLTGAALAAMSLLIVTFAPALRQLELRGLVVVIAFVAPALLVVFHSRRRDVARKTDG